MILTENQLENLDVKNNTKLTNLYCSNNKLTSLDISANTELWEVECIQNKITSLNTGESTKLLRIDCSDNELEKIDVSKNTGLMSLGCSGNRLATLDISQNTVLTGLVCSANKLKSLDISQNSALNYLCCSENEITALNLKKNPLLETLECFDNRLKELDLSNNLKISKVLCGNNQLAFLDITGNSNLKELDCKNNKYPITVDKNGQFDLKEISGFKTNKAKDFKNAVLKDTILTLEELITVSEVKYTYACGSDPSLEYEFAFQVNFSQIQIILDGNGGKINGQEAKKIELKCGEPYTGLVAPTLADYNFDGWYTQKEGGRRISTADKVSIKDFEESGELRLYAHWTKIRCELKVELLEPTEIIYSGKAIKPIVIVKTTDSAEGSTLVEGKDYTIKYSNNTAANMKTGDVWWNEKKKPTITITGKGNYTGSSVIYFEIKPYQFTQEDSKEVLPVTLSDSSNGAVWKASPVVKWNGKTLKKNVDYILEYNPNKDKADEYVITVKGKEKSNFTGEFTVKEIITSKVSMSKVKVSPIAGYSFKDDDHDGLCDPIKPEALYLKLTYGGRTLNLNQDYIVEDILNYQKAGTATVILTAKEGSEFAGSIAKTFKIVGRKLTGSNVTLVNSKITYDPTYNPKDLCKEFPKVVVTWGPDKILLSENDYEIKYPETIKKGKMKITITGKGLYYGTVSKTFSVSAYKVTQDNPKIVIEKPPVVSYMKEGAQFKPEQLDVKFNDGNVMRSLIYGTDYTVSYSNNKNINRKSGGAWDDELKIPKAKLIFKGNYAGSKTVEFEIGKKDLSEDPSMIYAQDILFSTSVGKYITKVTLTDLNGKVLKEGSTDDYILDFYRGKFTLEQIKELKLKPLDSTLDHLKGYDDGTRDEYVTVVATGRGNYDGQISYVYNVKKGLLDNASVTLAPGVNKYYKGENQEVVLSSDEIIVMDGTKKLSEGFDYEVAGYENNTKVGTATVIIKGIGNYGGCRKMKFSIKKRTVSIWDNLLKYLQNG